MFYYNYVFYFEYKFVDILVSSGVNVEVVNIMGLIFFECVRIFVILDIQLVLLEKFVNVGFWVLDFLFDIYVFLNFIF